jgi:resuscitation-promoting factor RpfC
VPANSTTLELTSRRQTKLAASISKRFRSPHTRIASRHRRSREQRDLLRGSQANTWPIRLRVTTDYGPRPLVLDFDDCHELVISALVHLQALCPDWCYDCPGSDTYRPIVASRAGYGKSGNVSATQGESLRMNAVRRSMAITAIIGLFVAASIVLSTGVANADGLNWDAVAQCESGGDWSANTGNGHYGGLQISQATWNANGGVGSPANATRQQQIAVANRILATQGTGAWPKCGAGRAVPLSPTTVPLPLNHLRATVNQLISIFLPHQ